MIGGCRTAVWMWPEIKQKATIFSFVFFLSPRFFHCYYHPQQSQANYIETGNKLFNHFQPYFRCWPVQSGPHKMIFAHDRQPARPPPLLSPASLPSQKMVLQCEIKEFTKKANNGNNGSQLFHSKEKWRWKKMKMTTTMLIMMKKEREREREISVSCRCNGRKGDDNGSGGSSSRSSSSVCVSGSDWQFGSDDCVAACQSVSLDSFEWACVTHAKVTKKVPHTHTHTHEPKMKMVVVARTSTHKWFGNKLETCAKHPFWISLTVSYTREFDFGKII